MGIYHVMMRGINRQNIFEERQDYSFFISCLRRVSEPDEDKKRACNILAYCCMTNHCHILIQEKEKSVGESIKWISNAYAFYYNQKYERTGHLFQNRFRSEPCDDKGYFLTVLRYIHLNPVKGGLCKKAEQYPYSSWRNDYIRNDNPLSRIDLVYKMIDPQELVDFMSLECDYQGIDSNANEGYRLTNHEVKKIFMECGVETVAAFQQLDDCEKRQILTYIKHQGASIRQLARFTGVSEGVIRRL